MHNTQIFRIDERHHIAYKKLDFGGKVTVVFFHGFMSSMQSTKATEIFDYCLSHKINCIIFDYFGHGESSGNFVDCTLSDWRSSCSHVIKSLTSTPLVIVGSSMGGWLALLAAISFPERVKGLVGLASAADFTEDLNLTESEYLELQSAGFVEIWVDQCSYTITRDLLDDGKNHLLLTKDEIPLECPVELIHALDDDLVSWQTSVSIAEKIKSENVHLHLLKPGGHNLNDSVSIALILETIQNMVNRVELAL